MIVATGSKGFIGRVLLRRGRENGRQISSVEGDVLDLSDRDLIPSADTIVHLAAVTGEKNYSFDPRRGFRTNVEGTRRVVDIAAARNLHLIFASTAGVYAPPTSGEPVDEESHCDPVLEYAKSKLAAEQIIQEASEKNGLNATILRIFNVYGPNQSGDSLIAYLARTMHAGEIPVLRRPQAIRDFVFADDAVDALLAAVDRPPLGFRIVNVGSGLPTTVQDVADKIAEVLGITADFSLQKGPPEYDCIVADIRKASRCLSWRPATALGTGIRQVVEAIA